ncbi:HAD family hydrolase [Sphingomonas dokdonensis]|uniref:Haloacid dehalogenase-like hydrolase n=1 Tax=Sphingomonas dokdonensis TaxID=344880 RepID=A0A245ZU61_9SPHN|nr:HAD family hydrolase [Sphingomonas dokdonensis]OWK33272.1 haloacid dehalogenase-like hydrolase [Sphingomonas dokdonensis]
MPIKLILLDADDTLWHNMRHFEVAEQAFTGLLATFAEAGIARSTLATIEERNLAHYGYGAKSFTLSMIEAALALGGADLPVEAIARILETGRNLLQHPVELLDGVGDTIEALAELGDLVLLTKGDLLHQEMKLAASGLGILFSAVEIVSDKTVETFQRLFARRSVDPAEAIMAGDSLRSDIHPALAAGAWAAFVPQPLAWSHEHAAEPVDQPRYRRLASLGALPALIAEINAM